MSSHREAPEISKDPVADSADLYAFVSPDKPDHVTIIANYVPLQGPDAGPNFFEFGDDVLYQINISTRGDAHADISYNFHFTTHVGNPETFLYNTGQITSLDSPSFNRRQTYSVTKVVRGKKACLPREPPAVPSVQHRTAVHTELRPPRQAGRALDPGRWQGLCRAAR